MNPWSTIVTTSKTELPKDQILEAIKQQLPGQIFCIGLGLLSGTTGVAITIGLVIMIQELLFRMATFSPGVIGITIAATVAGLGVSWLLDQVAPRFLPGLYYNLAEDRLKLVMILSVFTTLVQALLFTYGL
jgi:hypothetical protein